MQVSISTLAGYNALGKYQELCNLKSPYSFFALYKTVANNTYA